MRSFMALLLLMALILTAGCDDSKKEKSVFDQFQSAIEDGLEVYASAGGISAAIILEDGTLWEGVTGVSHAGARIESDMLFSAGSITKTFTAVAILKLYQDGVLDLEDPISDWLPPFPNVDSTITIRQLLNHTSGLFDLVEHDNIWPALFGDMSRTWTIEEALNSFVAEPYFEPGAGWHYSSTGYLLLRLILEEATESGIAAAYQDGLCVPAGMNSTYVAPYETLPANTAHGWFDFDGDGDYDDMGSQLFTAFYSTAGGGVFSTAEDMAIIARALFHDRSILEPTTFAEALDFVPTAGEPLAVGYGLGIYHADPDLYNGIQIWGHSGNPIGYAALSFYLVDYGISIGIMVNTEDGEAMNTISELLDIIESEFHL